MGQKLYTIADGSEEPVHSWANSPRSRGVHVRVRVISCSVERTEVGDVRSNSEYSATNNWTLRLESLAMRVPPTVRQRKYSPRATKFKHLSFGNKTTADGHHVGSAIVVEEVGWRKIGKTVLCVGSPEPDLQHRAFCVRAPSKLRRCVFETAVPSGRLQMSDSPLRQRPCPAPTPQAEYTPYTTHCWTCSRIAYMSLREKTSARSLPGDKRA